MSKVSRRQLLKTAAVGATAVGVAASSVGFAQEFFAKPSTLLGPAKGMRVVIIGGGWGGVSTARHLRRANPEIEVILIEKNPAFFSCPISNLWLGGLTDLGTLVYDYRSVTEAGVTIVNERAIEVNRSGRWVRTTSGIIFYNYLVVSPGIDYM